MASFNGGEKTKFIHIHPISELVAVLRLARRWSYSSLGYGTVPASLGAALVASLRAPVETSPWQVDLALFSFDLSVRGCYFYYLVLHYL